MPNQIKFCCFEKKIFDEIKNRPIYLVGINRTCFSDLCDIYDIADNIEGVFDDKIYPSYRSCVMGKHVFNVLSTKSIADIPSSAVLIVMGGDFVYRCSQLSMMPDVQKRFRTIYYFPNQEGRYALFYQQKYKHSDLENIIILRSGTDASFPMKEWEFADNVRALFEYLLSKNFNKKYKLVWLVQNPNRYNAKYQNLDNVEFLPYHGAWSKDQALRDAYYKTVCLAKYAFFCHSFLFARYFRSDQIRVQLWHGCGFKTNNNYIFEEQCLRYEYMTVTSDFYSEIHAKAFGLRSNQMLITGLPKNDWIFHPIANWQEILGIPNATKYIFWLPTFRNDIDNNEKRCGIMVNTGTGMPVMNSIEQLYKLNQILLLRDIVLLVKLHPAQDRTGILDYSLSNIVLLDNALLLKNGIDINELLGHADALISDYSSVATGYMLLDRPIAFTLDDYETYRGFHWPKEKLKNWLPGEEIYNYDDFIQFVQNIAEGKDTSQEKRHHLMPFFHKYCDDQSCARILDALGISMD